MSLSLDDGWLACRECGVASPIVSNSSWSPAEPEDDSPDTRADFLAQHAGHCVTLLHRCDDAEILSNRPLWDPMATVSFDVTDGQDSYVLTASRVSIEEPRSYRFIPGRLTLTSATIECDARGLRRGLDREFYPHALRPTKVDRFIAVLRELISGISPDTLEIAFDAADDPAVSIVSVPDAIYDDLCHRCADIFDTAELPQVHEFLRDNRGADGLLALRVQRNLCPPVATGAVPRTSRFS